MTCDIDGKLTVRVASESNSAFSTFLRLNAMQGIKDRVNAPASKRSNSENGAAVGRRLPLTAASDVNDKVGR